MYIVPTVLATVVGGAAAVSNLVPASITETATITITITIVGPCPVLP